MLRKNGDPGRNGVILLDYDGSRIKLDNGDYKCSQCGTQFQHYRLYHQHMRDRYLRCSKCCTKFLSKDELKLHRCGQPSESHASALATLESFNALPEKLLPAKHPASRQLPAKQLRVKQLPSPKVKRLTKARRSGKYLAECRKCGTKFKDVHSFHQHKRERHLRCSKCCTKFLLEDHLKKHRCGQQKKGRASVESPKQLPTKKLSTGQPLAEQLPITQLPSVDVPEKQLPTEHLPSVELPVTQLPTELLPTEQLPTKQLPPVKLSVKPTKQLFEIDLSAKRLPLSVELPVKQLSTIELPAVALSSKHLLSDQFPSVTVKPLDKPSLSGNYVAECHQCGAKYKQMVSYHKHRKNRHLCCVRCCTRFLTEDDSKKHQCNQLNECKLCKKYFINPANLSKHLEVHRDYISGVYRKCDKCKQEFPDALRWMQHIHVTTEGVSVCINRESPNGEASDSLPQPSSNASKKRSSKRLIICSICGASFAGLNVMNYHKMIHPEYNPPRISK